MIATPLHLQERIMKAINAMRLGVFTMPLRLGVFTMPLLLAAGAQADVVTD